MHFILKNHVPIFILAMTISAAITTAQAQIPPSDLQTIIRQQEQIQRQQEESRQELERRAKEGSGRRSTLPLPPPVPPSEPSADACVQVQRIEVEDATQLSDEEISAIIAPFQNRCLALSDLNELMRALTQAYVNKGFVAARPYLPQQDVGGGVLRLIIVEGKVEDIEPQPGGSTRAQEMLFAFPGVIGAPLNLRDIEQGLDQINRLRSNNATMALEPGSA